MDFYNSIVYILSRTYETEPILENILERNSLEFKRTVLYLHVCVLK